MHQLFFDEGNYHPLRRDFYEFLTNRFRQCFTKPYQKWCHDHGLQFTGHLMNEDTLTAQTEWVGAVMPHYLDMDMPGIDKLGSDLSNTVLVKQLGSVAEQTGKQALCEAFGCTGHQAGPQTLKRIADWLCVQGVSFINPHLMLYSMRGERKRDYPPDISWVQPWFADAKGLFDHMSRVCQHIHTTQETADTLVIHPIGSVWAEFSPLHKISPTYSIWAEKNPYAGANYIKETEQFEKPFFDLSMQLNQKGIGYHYGDERVMEEIGGFDGGIRIGKCCYQTVIVPPVSTLKENTVKLLTRLAETAGKEAVIFAGQIPDCVPRKELFTAAGSVPGAVAMANARFARGVVVTDRVTGKYPDKLLCRYAEESVFIVNPEQDRAFALEIRAPFAPAVLDTFSGNCYQVPCEKDGENYVITLTLSAGGSLLLCRFSTQEQCPGWLQSGISLQENRKKPLVIQPTIRACGENILPLDIVDLQLPDRKLTQKPVELLWHTAFYPLPEGTQFTAEYKFYVEQVPEKSMKAYMEMARNLDEILLNGVKQQIGNNDRENPLFDESFDLITLQNLKAGENVITITGKKCNNIIGIGNHKGVPENQAHAPTELEGIYLCGDFGGWPGQEGYFLGKTPDRIWGTLQQCGYPFYSGKMTAEFTLPENCCRIRLQAKSQSAALYLEGKLQDISYIRPFSFCLQPSKQRQQARVVFSSGVENTFGPLHLAGRDRLSMIGPQLIANADRYTPEYVLLDYAVESIICDLES